MKRILKFLMLLPFLLAGGVVAQTVAAEETVPMYRMYNQTSGEHFYTGNTNEVNSLIKSGWGIYEGIGWYAPRTSSSPVYRMYNPNSGDHHYTRVSAEKDGLVKAGWKYEGIGWYSSDSRQVPLLRAYNPNALTGNHNYTRSNNEQASLLRAGWHNEGVGWYGSATPAANADAQFRALAQYNVNFVMNNGEGTRTLTYYRDVAYNLLAPKMTGRKFIGWSINNDASVEYPATQKWSNLAGSGKTQTLYAVYGEPDLKMIISRSDFRVFAVDASTGTLVRAMKCVIGGNGNVTPLGNYTVLRKLRVDYMPLAFGNVPYCAYFTSNGIAFHEASWRYSNGTWNLGYAASHGCINLASEDAKWVYEHTRVGTPVEVTDAHYPQWAGLAAQPTLSPAQVG
jgi:lipoprotein-anchoring transpeptidase ErfK/SrfK